MVTARKGYKWYDRSTFKPGSYGSSQSGSDNNDESSSNDNSNSHHDQTGNAEFNLPQGIQPNHPFKVTVKLKGYDANSTINNLTVGIYKDGGKQIGSFSSDGSQFSQPGYSKDQTVKTDSNGEATLTLTAKVSEDFNGAHIRLKQGKK